MIERRIINCKGCNQEKEAILDGKFDERNKRWVDKEGRAWNGRRCPSCHADKIKNRMSEMRFKKKQETV